jgi:fibronectin type 3 domain-containing protein
MSRPFSWLRGAARRRPITWARLELESIEARLAPAVNVLTFHNDIASTGLNPAETQLSPANVKVNSFGKIYTVPLDGQVYAQPLIDTGVTIANGPNTQPGAAGIHDVVFAATENDTLYAIDGGPVGGQVLWKRVFLDASNPSNNTLGATAIVPVSNNDVGSSDINPSIGITGTPVIDPATNTIYVVTKTKETIGGATHFVQRLHAINLADGTDRLAPYLIGDTTNGNTNNTQVYVYGSGDGHVTDPYNGTGQQVVQFNALREHQRGALNLVNGKLYVEWASHGDQGPYHGWVVVWDVSSLAGTGWKLSGVLNVSPNGGLAGIWQSGGRLAFEPDGSAFYFETGNGPSSHPNPTLDANGFPTDGNYYEALVKVVADTTTTPTSQNKNGWGMKVADYFIPFNQVALDNADRDFGSGAPTLLPASAGIAGHPKLMVATGKEGKIYVVDRDNLGKFDPNNDHVLNAVPDGSGHNTPPVQLGGGLSTAGFFNGKIYWTSNYSSTARAYAINSNGTLTITSQTTATFGSLPGSVALSSNGTMAGIAWVMDRNANQIHAYDAATFATELWNSGQKAGGADNLGAVVKFAVPTIANGQAYVGTSNSLVVYGLTPPANSPPSAPTLSATALSGTSINLTWTDPTAPPNTANGYKVEQSLDGTNFTQVTTAPPGATALAVGGLTPQTKYYFRIRGFNGLGDSPYSNIANATTTNQVATLDFSGGFAGSTNKLTYNGSAVINGTKAELTNGGTNQAGSVFSTNPVDITRFTTQFTFQIGAGTATADGFTFTIQGGAATALGSAGGGLGYGTDGTNPGNVIGNSVAVKFDLFSNAGEGVNSTGLYLNGASPTSAGSVNLTGTGIDLHSGHVFQVTMNYDGTTLTVTTKDTSTNASATQNYTVNVTGAVGGTTARVGFTGGTGGQVATQDILTWTFAPNAPQAPNAPSGLGGTPANATAITLTWTNNATNQTGFHLDRATDPNFTTNLITLTLPASPNSFTDTATGLAPGSTFYYRLRAFNTAGDSANSNVAAVSIPLAPPKPTDAQVVGVATNRLDLSWTDNAGSQADNYVILRSVNGGTFTNYATLPPGSATPPSTYTWSDTGVVPGTGYEYHIEAVNVSGNNDFIGANAITLTLPPGSVTATPGTTSVTLAWSAPTGAIQYNVYRGTSAGGEGATPIASGVTATTFTDTGLTTGTMYFYEVTAVNANVNHVPVLPAESAPSAEVSTTPGVPAAPASPTATANASNTATPTVVLTWTAVSGATSYRVYRSTSGNGEAGTAPIATGLTTTTFTDTTGAFATTYFYKITAVNAVGEGPLSAEASATPLLLTRVNITNATGEAVANYLADVGLAYGSRVNGLTFGWNVDNTANARNRNAANSPDELHDSLNHMQKPANPNAWWGIAVPNGTYRVDILTGDPSNIDSVYAINAGGTLNTSTNTVSGGVLVVSGTPTTATHWFENVVPVTVTSGVLYISNGTGSSNNKLDAVVVSQVLPGAHFANFASTAGLQLNGSAAQSGTALRLTSGATNQAASAFTTTAVDVAKFTTQFDFQIGAGANTADGFTFTIQGGAATALGSAGGGLGYGTDGTNPGNTIGKSVAVKFDLFSNAGEGVNSTGLFLNGASPTSAGSTDLTGTGIDLHSGHVFRVTMGYDGTTLTVTIKDMTTNATATQRYVVDIVSAVGGPGFVGFTAGTGGLTATQDILAWDFTPVP